MARILADLAETTARGFAVSAMNFSLWAFSLDVYARPGVAAECLTLQDGYGIDINILLWCLWLETQRKPLTPERLEKALGLVSPWADSTVHPLRQMRRQLKNQYGATDSLIENLRQSIKQAELHAEQQQQWLLHSLSLEWAQQALPLTAGENVQAYFAHHGIIESIRNPMIKQLIQLMNG